MDQSPTLTSALRSQSGTGRDALAPLTFLGWRLGLTAIVAGLAASFFLCGYALVYWRNADMDLMVVYNALVLNDGKPQQFFDHTGYVTILSVKAWFEMLHAFGLLGSWSLSTMPPASNPQAFDAAMTDAIRAGRLLAWLTASACVLIFASLIRAVVRDRRLALIATFAFAFSGGIAVHERILRTELVAACPVIFALMILIVVGRRASVARPLWMALAAALCMLGLENKVQAVLLIAALPFLSLPFGGAQGASVAFWRDGRSAFLPALVAVVAAIVAVWMAWPLITTGFDRSLLDAAGFHALLLGRFGIYQLLLLVVIGACLLTYAALWRISAAETVTSMAAVAAGASLALLMLNIDYNANNVIAVFNPLEKMLKFVDAGTSAAASQSSASAIFRLLLDGLASVAARYSFVLHSSPRPTVFITWLIVPGIVYARLRGERQAAIQAFLLLMAAVGIDALGVRRGLKSEYFIFTDPLIILAGALLLDRMPDLRFQKWAYPIALVLFTLQIAISQAEPVKYAFMRRGPESICEWNQYYLPLMPLPWCPAGRS
ncbi:hypothetical protein [Bradyrhizobium sp.]|uniref:hypothetical protein n=1 Tax=Bradyrhizobium sp. TaxID=376 RepID=UPI00261A8308|nr:hypothetical protein [Bradyrhizobium sp.]